MGDKYDVQIEHLTQHPEEIPHSWIAGEGLFRFCTPGTRRRPLDGKECGCLTMVRGGFAVAWTKELTTAIRRDRKLPKDVAHITVADLPTFAKWQRRLDREIRGKKPRKRRAEK